MAHVKITEKLMRLFSERMSQGDNLLNILSENGMPSYSGVMKAISLNDDLYNIYREGRVRQAEFYSDRINRLATDPLPKFDDQGAAFDSRWLNAEVQRRKLEIETLKWTLGRTQPWGIRDKKEDAVVPQTITISWGGGDTAISATEEQS